MTLSLHAIVQSNEPAGDLHDFMQVSAECDYWVSGRAQLRGRGGLVKGRGASLFTYPEAHNMQIGPECELNMWHAVAPGMMDI